MDLFVKRQCLCNDRVQSLKQSNEDIKAGRTVSFKNTKDALSYIDSLIADDRQNTKKKNWIFPDLYQKAYYGTYRDKDSVSGNIRTF
jgi:hypothetical protein